MTTLLKNHGHRLANCTADAVWLRFTVVLLWSSVVSHYKTNITIAVIIIT